MAASIQVVIDCEAFLDALREPAPRQLDFDSAPQSTGSQREDRA